MPHLSTNCFGKLTDSRIFSALAPTVSFLHDNFSKQTLISRMQIGGCIVLCVGLRFCKLSSVYLNISIFRSCSAHFQAFVRLIFW